MQKYEKTIGLKTLSLTILRRWKAILIVFIPSSIIVLIVTQFFIPKQFQSSVTLLNNTNLNATSFNAVQLQIQK